MPSMNPFLLGKRGKNHIINLEETLQSLRRALFVIREVQALGGNI